MGDVFDAMDRAGRERGDKPRGRAPSAPASSDEVSADDTQPALPLEEVKGQGAFHDEPAPVKVTAPAAGARPILAAAVEKARAEGRDTATAPFPDVITGRRNPSLNGYAPEVVVHHDRGSLITEQYRAIRTHILARARNRRLQTHVVTSSSPSEGKTVTTINLGMAFSELRNQRTLILEGDLRRPSFARVLQRETTPGLLQLLRGEIDDIDKVIHPTVYENLQFLPAGSQDLTTSTELLSSPRMAQVLDRLKDRYDHIFIDTPPVVTVTDAAILGAMSDEVLLVVRLHRTATEMVERAKRLLRAANCELAGVILTHQEVSIPKYPYRYAYHK